MKEGGGSFFKDRLEASGGVEIGKGPFGSELPVKCRPPAATRSMQGQRPLISRRLSGRGARSAPWQSDCFVAALLAMTVCFSTDFGSRSRSEMGFHRAVNHLFSLFFPAGGGVVARAGPLSGGRE